MTPDAQPNERFHTPPRRSLAHAVRCLSGLLTALALTPLTAANLIPNPGFESAAGSELWGGSARVATNQHSGTYAAELKQQDATWGGGYERTISGLSPSTTYTFSAYVKTVGGTAKIGVKNHGTTQITQSFDAASYTLQQVTFTTGSSSTSATCFVWNDPGNATLAYADDMSLVEVMAPAPTYDLIFSDEFNGEGPIDSAKWKPEIGFVRNHEAQYYRAENLSESGGNLVITARREPFPNPNYDPNSTNWKINRQYADWTSGSIRSGAAFNFLYGRIECRAKVTNLPGTWPAIWTLGGGPWPSTGEIDLMENYGGKILANFATAGSGTSNAVWDGYSKSVSLFPSGWVNNFHLWELEWSPTAMEIRLDGVVLNSFNPATRNSASATYNANVAPFQTFGQLLLLNLAIGGDAGGSTTNLPDETVYLVDYIRVYQGSIAPPQLAVAKTSQTDLRFTFDTVIGRRYTIMESSDLRIWTPLTHVRGTGATMIHTEAVAGARKFYLAGPDNSLMIDPDTPLP